MATIDELSIEIESSGKKANKDIDALSKSLLSLQKSVKGLEGVKLDGFKSAMKSISDSAKSLRGMKELSSAVKSLQSLSNVSSTVKSIDKVAKSADGLKDIKADINVKDFDSAVAELEERFKDAGMDFTFSGSTSEIEKEIKSLYDSLDRLLRKQDKMRAIGTDVKSKGFAGLQYDISETVNKLQILEEELKKVKSSTSEKTIPKSTPDVSLDYYKESLAEYRGVIKELEETYKGIFNIPKGKLDTPIENIKTDIEDIKVLFPGATKELSDLEKELEKFQNIASELHEKPIELKVDAGAIEGIKKVSEEAENSKIELENLQNTLDELEVPEVRETNLDKLYKSLEKAEQKVEKLYLDFGNKSVMGEISFDVNDKGFVGLQKKITLAEKEAQALRDKISEISQSNPNLANAGISSIGKTLKDAKLSAEQFREYLDNIEIPKIRETNLKKLQAEFERTQKKLDSLIVKSVNWANKGVNPDSTKFRNLQEEITITAKTAGALKDKIEDLSRSSPDKTADEIEDINKTIKNASLSTEEFGEYLKNIKIPEINETSLKKLQSELERTEKKLDELTVKSDNWANKGVNPDSKQFRNLQEQIVALSKKSESLKEKIKEVGQTKPNVSGWQKLTAVASTIDKAFSAIKRGVSSALSSIKKLGTGFKNLQSVVKKVSNAIGKMFNSIVQLAGKATSAIASSVKGISSAFSKLSGGNSGLQTATSGLGKLAKVATGLVAAGGLVSFGKQAVELGSDITEVENVVDTAFGSMADKVYNFASTAAEQFGLSELAAKQYSGTMMAMLKSSGVAQGTAADMSVTLAGLAGDLASFYNIDTDTAFQKLRAGISGETEPLKQLGINMNIVNLEAYAMSQGITKSYQSMTLAEQTILRYNYILAKTSDAQGDFASTAGTWANQLRLLRLNIQSISAIIGQGLIAALLPAIKLLNKFMAKLTEVAKKFRDFMYVLFGKKIESPMRGVVDDMADMVDYDTDLSGISNSAEDVEDGMEDAADGMDSATDSAKKLKKALSVLGFDELNQLNANLDDLDTSKVSGTTDKLDDLGLDDIGLGNIDDMFDDLYDKAEIEPINEWARRLREAFLNHDWEGLGKTIAEMVNIGLKKLYDFIKDITPKVESAMKALAKVINSFVKWLDWDLLGRTIGAGINLLARAFNALFGPDGIDLEQLGRKLSVGLRGMIDEVDWRGLGNAIGNYFMIAWRIASGFVEDMWRINPDTLLTGWTETGIALAEAVHGIFERINFKQIGDTIAGGFNGIVEIISSFRDKMASNHTWSMIAIGVSEGFNSIIDNIDLSKAAQEISGLALDILHAMNQSAELTHWEEFGYKVAEGLFSIPWLQLFNQVFDLVSATFGSAIEGFTKYLTAHAEQLGQNFADVFNTLFDKIKYITNSIPWDDIGTAISTFLNIAISKIKPIQAATNLGNFVTSLLGTMLKVAQETDWNALGRAIGNFIAAIPWGTMFKQAFDIVTTTIRGLVSGIGSTLIYQLPAIGTTMAEGFNYAMERLREFVANVSWEDIGLYISTGLNNMITGIDWETAGETFGSLVKGLIDTIFTVAMNTDWIGFARGIGEFLDGIPWLEILGEVALTIGDIVAEVLAGLLETTSGRLTLFLGALWLVVEGFQIGNKALGVVNEFAKNFGLLPEGVTSVVPVLREKISLIAGEGGLLFKISSTAKTVATNAGNFLGTIGSVVFSPTGLLIAGIAIGVALIVTHWDEIKEAAGKVKEWVSEKFSQLKENVSKSMNKLGESVKEGWNKAQEKFQSFDNFLSGVFNRDWTKNFGAFGNVLNAFFKNVSSIWESIKKIFSGVINFVAGVFTGDWSRAWQGVKQIFSGVWNGFAAIVKQPVNSIIGILNSLISGVAFAVNSVGEILNSMNIDIPDWVPLIGGKKLKFNFPKWTPGKFPYLEQGGILKRGQVGILEGNGAEAVIPLERNRQWISKVSEEMARNNYNYSGGGIDEDMIANAVAEGVAMALMNNIDNLSSSNQQPISITVKLENDEAIARAAIRGQQRLDYRMNPTPSYGY